MENKSRLAFAFFGLLFLFAPLVIAVDPYASFVKTASPSSVALGDNITITINATGSGDPLTTTKPTDVMLVVDRSGSMTDSITNTIVINQTNGTIATQSVFTVVQTFSVSPQSAFDVIIAASGTGHQYDLRIQKPDGTNFSQNNIKGAAYTKSFASGDWQNGTWKVWMSNDKADDLTYQVTSQKTTTTTKINAAKEGANTFVDVLNETAQGGLVSFSTSSTLDKQLALMTASNKTALKTAINALSASGNTNTGDAINKATTELTSVRARSGAIKFMVLMSDGQNNTGPSVYAAAQNAKNNNITIYTIGFGADADAVVLGHVADLTGGRYYYAPDANTLRQIYEEIAQEINNIAATSLYVTDILSPSAIWVGPLPSGLPSGCSYDNATKTLSCYSGSLAINSSWVIQFNIILNGTGSLQTNGNASSYSYTAANGSTQSGFLGSPVVNVGVGSATSIKILSGDSCASPEVGDVALTADESRTWYAYSFDGLGNCRGPESVAWSVTTLSGVEVGSVSPGTGASTAFDAENVGTGFVTATLAGSALSDDTGTITVTHGTATALDVTPHLTNVTADDNVTYSATASDGDGNEWDATANTTFNDPIGYFVANIYHAGQVGVWEVNGTYGALYAKAVVNVAAGALESITVECVPSVVELLQSGQCTASCFDADENPIASCDAEWSSTTSAVIVEYTAFYGAEVGYSNVTATIGNVTGADEVQVVSGDAVALDVSPSSATVYFGNTEQFTAACENAYNATIPCVGIVWQTDVGAVDGNGLFTAQNTSGIGTVNASVDSIFDYADVTIQTGCNYTEWQDDVCVSPGWMRQTRTDSSNYTYCTELEQNVSNAVCDCSDYEDDRSCVSDGYANVTYAWNYGYCGSGYTLTETDEDCSCIYSNWTNTGCVADGTMRQDRTDSSGLGYCTDLTRDVSDSQCACQQTDSPLACVSDGYRQHEYTWNFGYCGSTSYGNVEDATCNCQDYEDSRTCVSPGFANVTYAWNYGYCGETYVQTETDQSCDSNYSCNEWHYVEGGYDEGCFAHHYANQTRRCTDQYANYYDQFRVIESGVCDCIASEESRACVSDGDANVTYVWNYNYCGDAYTQTEDNESCSCAYSDWANTGCSTLGLMSQTRTDSSGFEYCTDLTRNVEDSVCECTPGDEQNQTGDCVFGGFQTRVCAQDYSWGPWGTCQNEGNCTPNATQTQACGNGGSQTRTCQSNYVWGSWGDCTGSVVYISSGGGGSYYYPLTSPTPTPTPKPSVAPSEQPPAPSPSPRPPMGDFDLTMPTAPSALPLGEEPAPITGLFAFANSSCVGALLLLAIIAGWLAHYASQKKKIVKMTLWLAVAVMFLIPFAVALLLNDACQAVAYAVGEDIILALLAFAVKKKML